MLIRFMALLAAVSLLPDGDLVAQQRPQLNDGDAHGDAPYLLEDGWTPLFNGRDLSGWHGLGSGKNEWFTAQGIFWDRLLGPTRLGGIGGPGDRMLNGHGSTVNLVSDQKFGDIELYLEFMLAKGSNSGVYLHGLYEVQIFDSYGSTEPVTSSDGGTFGGRCGP